MIYDLGGGMTCAQCQEIFEFIPVDSAYQLGLVPAGAQLVPAYEAPAEALTKSPFWAGEGWPKYCFYCRTWENWLFPVFPKGASFFRS